MVAGKCSLAPSSQDGGGSSAATGRLIPEYFRIRRSGGFTPKFASQILVGAPNFASKSIGNEYSTIFFSWTALGILLKFTLCHFDDYDDYLEHFQLLTSIYLQLNAIKKIIKTTTHHFATTIKLYD